MRKIFFIFVLVSLIFAPVFAKTKINVIKIYDGDSILASIDENVFRIRLIDIDCFEGTNSKRAKWQAKKYKKTIDEIVEGGNLAGEILKNKLKNQEVYFEFRGIDKYNRALGYIYVNSENINKQMLKTNYCKSF